MLRINLIPDYVAQRRVSRFMTGLFTGVFLAIVGGMLGYVFGVLAPNVQSLKSDATNAVNGKALTDGLRADAALITSKAQPTKAKLDYVDAVHQCNLAWAQLYDKLARFTDTKMVYYSANVSGSTMTISAYAPSIREVGIYLTRIYQEPDFTNVNIDRLPGYPEAVVKKYYLQGHLIGVSSTNSTSPGGGAPSFGGGAPGGFGGGQPGFGGGQPGFGGGQPGFGGGQPAFAGGAPAAGGARSQSFGSHAPLGPGYDEPKSSFDALVNAEKNPEGTALSDNRLEERELRNIVVKTSPQGFNITITATISADTVKALTPPALPSGTGAGA